MAATRVFFYSNLFILFYFFRYFQNNIIWKYNIWFSIGFTTTNRWFSILFFTLLFICKWCSFHIVVVVVVWWITKLNLVDFFSFIFWAIFLNCKFVRGKNWKEKKRRKELIQCWYSEINYSNIVKKRQPNLLLMNTNIQINNEHEWFFFFFFWKKKNKNGNNNRMIEKYDYNKAILVIKLFFTNLKNKLRTKEKKLLMKSTGNILELNWCDCCKKID